MVGLAGIDFGLIVGATSVLAGVLEGMAIAMLLPLALARFARMPR